MPLDTPKSPQDRMNIDGYILHQQLEDMVIVQLVEPASSSLLQVGSEVAFLDVKEESKQRYCGTVTSLRSDVEITLLLDRVTMVEATQPTTDFSDTSSAAIDSNPHLWGY